MPNIQTQVNPTGSGTISTSESGGVYTIQANNNSGYRFLDWTLDGYTQLEYIESSGTQYINTGVPFNTKIKIELDVLFTTLAPENQIWGFTGNARCGIGTSGSSWWLMGGTITTNTWYSTSYELNGSNCILKVNGATTTLAMPIATPTNNAMLFGCIYTAGSSTVNHKCSARKKNIKIYSNNTLVRDFIPVIRHSDGQIGLLDLVHLKFYGNSGSGVFVGGSVV